MLKKHHPLHVNNWRLLALASLLLLLFLLVFLYKFIHKPAASQPRLTIYCAAALRKPVEAAAKLYQQTHPLNIRLNYGSSGELQSKLVLEKQTRLSRCDLYIPADPFFGQLARSNQLVRESLPLAQLQIILAVKPNSPFRIHSVRDLLDQKHHYAICNPQAGAGRRTQITLQTSGLWQTIRQRKKTAFPRVTEAANALKTSKTIQAAFLWDATAKQFGLQILHCPELANPNATAPINAHITTNSQNPKTALHFARFLAHPKKGQPLFKKFHFTPSNPQSSRSQKTLAKHSNQPPNSPPTKTKNRIDKKPNNKPNPAL